MTGLRGSIEIFSYTSGQSAIVPIVDSGPHFTDDPYWLTNSRPNAERTANKSGLDLTPQTVHDLGLPTKVIDNSTLRALGYPNGLIIINTPGDSYFNWRFVK
jgi:hypothetical protein